MNIYLLPLVILHPFCRHPEPSSRPQFCAIVVTLQQPDFQILKLTQEDIAAFDDEKAGVLGSPLEKGCCLYHDLQFTYKTNIIYPSDDQPH